LLAACDIYRPAAISQLETVGAQVGVSVFQMGAVNPVDIAKAQSNMRKRTAAIRSFSIRPAACISTKR
jgi:signal recognition particle subunit SRP54